LRATSVSSCARAAPDSVALTIEDGLEAALLGELASRDIVQPAPVFNISGSKA
jgi:hypothetical protein